MQYVFLDVYKSSHLDVQNGMYHFPTSTIEYISLICSLASTSDSTNHPVAQLKFGDMFSTSPFPSPSLLIPNKNPKY